MTHFIVLTISLVADGK